jgi:DNA polymerase-1
MDLLLIDGPNLAYRAHFAHTKSNSATILSTSDGTPSAAVFGFASMLARVLDDYRPRHFVVAWEGDQSTLWRKNLHSGYKAHRNAQPLELSDQLVALDVFVRLMGGVSLGMGGAEADDVLATLARQAVEKAWNVGVVSSDKDLYGLLKPGVKLLRPAPFGGGMETWDIKRFCDHYGIQPESWRVRTALAGDASDGIPGVKSIGEKTALKLIKQWGDLDYIYANLDNIHPPRCAQLLRDGRESAYMSYEVAKMLDDLPLQLDELLQQAPAPDEAAITAYVELWELKSLAARLSETARLRRISSSS